MSNSDLRLPSHAGSYLLVLYLRRRTTVTVGRLGPVSLRRGWYLYCGSAFGPGGLRARLAHHLNPPVRYHWHIDYLHSAVEIRAICYCTGSNNEHRWSRQLAELPGAAFPVSGFGSSDCNCLSHLVYLPRRLRAKELRSCLSDAPVFRSLPPASRGNALSNNNP